MKILSAILLSLPLLAQTEKAGKDDLFRTISSLDTAVFDAYNRCDLEKFAGFFPDDVEFYHDQAGLMRTRQSVVEAVKNNICGKVRRELVAGSLEVYPLRGFGAVEIGVHRFYQTNSAKPSEPTGIAKFIHIWENRDGVWKINRVISFDHRALP